jgi:TatD DNase family protein
VSSAPLLVDAHAHVAEPDCDADRAAVLARAAAAGVTTIVCVGATGSVDSNDPAVALAGTHGDVRIVVSVGIHPHDAATADDAAFEKLRALAARPGVVALGETGLDYHYDNSPRPAQRDAFARAAALARELRLPLVVHVREAHLDAADALRGEAVGDAGVMVPCCTGDPAAARLPRPRLPRLRRGDRHVPERTLARCGTRRAGRPPARRDRRTVPRPGAASWKT